MSVECHASEIGGMNEQCRTYESTKSLSIFQYVDLPNFSHGSKADSLEVAYEQLTLLHSNCNLSLHVPFVGEFQITNPGGQAWALKNSA